jgi:hypothetical protein
MSRCSKLYAATFFEVVCHYFLTIMLKKIFGEVGFGGVWVQFCWSSAWWNVWIVISWRSAEESMG